MTALASSATSSVMVGTDVFTVRPFSSTRDQDNLSEMCKNVWGGTDYLPSIARVYEADPTCEFLVLEDEATGEMAAAGNRRFIDETETSVWLEAIRVSTKFEGRGIATNLMKELCRRSRTDGAREILSCTIDSNTPMMRLFGKEGIDMKPIRTACFPDLGALATLPGWSVSGLAGGDIHSENILKAMDLEHLIKDEPKFEQWEPIESEEELKKTLEVMEKHGRLGRIPAMGKLMWMSDDLKDSIVKGLVRRKVCKSDKDPPALFALVKDRSIQSLRSQYVCSIIATVSHDFDAAVWEACKSEYVPLLDGIPSFCFMYELPFPTNAKSVIEYFPQQIENAFTYHRWIANNI